MNGPAHNYGFRNEIQGHALVKKMVRGQAVPPHVPGALCEDTWLRRFDLRPLTGTQATVCSRQDGGRQAALALVGAFGGEVLAEPVAAIGKS